MVRFGFVALWAALVLGACTPSEITSRMDTRDELYPRFETPDNYTPDVVGARADNDFMRFSTMSMIR